jgi:DNA mismatch repair protein MutL
MGSIRVLPPEAARLIAAGEVIDRPAAALRELLDNAIDAGAVDVSVRIEEGGIALIRVVDDGDGMDREDLELAALPHATSKIRSADDLLRTRSLGFRGEALSSIAAAAELDILSMRAEARSAFRLRSRPGAPMTIEASAGRKGTTVTISELFKDFPARRQFLKRTQAEAALCRQIFEDKAAAHPGIRFSFESGSARLLILSPGESVSRISFLHPEVPRGFLHEVKFSGQGFEGSTVIAGPSFSRPDRRLMQVFVNRRRVQDWSLLQCLDYAFSGYLPGGLHPFAFLFLEIDPALADFNIHPAKKEVRLKDPEAPRRAIAHSVQEFLGALTRRDPAQAMPDAALELDLHEVGGIGEAMSALDGSRGPVLAGARSPSGYAGWPGRGDFGAVRERAAQGSGPDAQGSGPDAQGSGPDAPSPAAGFRYVGRALGPFILFERGDELWFLDQHAAHERLLFDELMARPPAAQELLVPETIEIEDEAEETRLAAAAERLAAAGFRIERDGGSWAVSAAPAPLAKGAAEAVRELARGSGDTARAACALAACRAAVKDGDELDPAAAESLIARALALPEPRCPHGRPIWSRITRDQMYRLVRREV